MIFNMWRNEDYAILLYQEFYIFDWFDDYNLADKMNTVYYHLCQKLRALTLVFWS